MVWEVGGNYAKYFMAEKRFASSAKLTDMKTDLDMSISSFLLFLVK